MARKEKSKESTASQREVAVSPAMPSEPSVLEYLDAGALKILQLSSTEARSLHLSEVSVECLLLALVSCGNGRAYAILSQLGFEAEILRRFIRQRPGSNGQAVEGPGAGEDADAFPLPFSAVFRKVLDMAFLQAKQYGSEEIGGEHILLGLLVFAEGHFLDLFAQLDVSVELIKTKTVEALEAAGGSARSAVFEPALFDSAFLESTQQSQRVDAAEIGVITGEIDALPGPIQVVAAGLESVSTGMAGGLGSWPLPLWTASGRSGHAVKLSFNVLSLVLLAESQCYGLSVADLNCQSLFLGVLLIAESYAARLLFSLGITAELIEDRLLERSPIEGVVLFSPAAEALVESSRQLARDLDQPEVTVEHLLLQMLTGESGELLSIQAFLEECKIDVGRMRKQLFEFITLSDGIEKNSPAVAISAAECRARDFDLLFALEAAAQSELFGRLDDSARLLLMLAAREALCWGRNFIDVEQLLLAALYVPGCEFDGLAAADVQEQIAAFTSYVPGLLVSTISLTERALMVLHEAMAKGGSEDVSARAILQALRGLKLGLLPHILEGAQRASLRHLSAQERSHDRPAPWRHDFAVAEASSQEFFEEGEASTFELEGPVEEAIDSFSLSAYAFTPLASCVLEHARSFADSRNIAFVQPGHIFYSLLKVDSELVALMGVSADADIDSLALLLGSKVGQAGKAGFGNDSLRILNLAADVQRLNNQEQLGTMHILIALCRAEDRSVSTAFIKLGLDPEELRRKLLRLVEAESC